MRALSPRCSSASCARRRSRPQSTADPAASPEAATVKKLLEQKFPGAAVSNVSKSAYFGLYEAQFDGQLVYTDAKVAYVMVGSIYDANTKQNLTEDRLRKLNRVGVGQPAVRPRDEEGQGQRHAQARDLLRCRLPVLRPARKRAEGRGRRDDLHVPLPDRPAAPGRRAEVEDHLVLARPAEGVGRVLRVRQAARQQGRLRHAARRDAPLGEKLRVNATPTLVFADGSIVPGALPKDRLEAELVKAEAESKSAPTDAKPAAATAKK